MRSSRATRCGADGKPDENDAYLHSFPSWKAYLVRAGAHPFTWETGLEVGQYSEGSADARVLGVVQGLVPLVVVEEESGVMGVRTHSIVVFRVDSPPQELATYSGDGVAVEITATGFVLTRCYMSYDERERGVDCMTLPDQVETVTYAWNGSELTAVSTIPYKVPPPKS